MIGTAGPKQQERVRALGATPIDYRDEDVLARVRELAPDGVAAVFDHVGGPGIDDSWRMLARGGTLVSYGTAATKDVPGNPQLPVLKLLAQAGRFGTCCQTGARRRSSTSGRATASAATGSARSCARTSSRCWRCCARARSTPQIAARFRLEQAAEALRFAEAGGNTGKVLLATMRASKA